MIVHDINRRYINNKLDEENDYDVSAPFKTCMLLWLLLGFLKNSNKTMND